MPITLATGKMLINPDAVLDVLNIQDEVFADLSAGGHGHFVLSAIKKRGERGRVIALNAYSLAHRALLSRLTEYGHHDVETLHADIESKRGTMLRDGEISVALLANSLHSLSSPLTALHEIRRILKYQGTLAIINPKETSPFFALAKTRGISEDTARYLFEDHGFATERRFDVGPHHICLVFRRQ